MLAYIGPFFNDLGTKRALAGKISLVYFRNGRIDFFLDQFITELGIAQRFNGSHFADVPEHFGCFLAHPVRVGCIHQDGENGGVVLSDIAFGQHGKPVFDGLFDGFLLDHYLFIDNLAPAALVAEHRNKLVLLGARIVHTAIGNVVRICFLHVPPALLIQRTIIIKA